MQEVILLLHLIGLGLLTTTLVAGFFLHRQYRKAEDIHAKAVIVRAAKPIGLLSPVAMVVMLITGIGNMHSLGYWTLMPDWLRTKTMVFAVAVIAGVLLAIASKRRSTLVLAMAGGEAPPDAEARLASLDARISLWYVVMPVILIVILYFSVIGRLGAP